MEFERDLNQFLKWFYICGLSCYPSFDGFVPEKKQKKRFVDYIPSGGLITFTVMALMGCSTYLYIQSSTHKKKSNTFLLVHIFAPILTMLVCTMQMVLLSSRFAKIHSQIRIFEHLSQNRFSIDSKGFRRYLMRRLYTMSITFFMPTAVQIFGGWTSVFMATVSITMVVLVFIAFVHAFFYIVLLDHLLDCFVRYVEMRANAVATSITKRTNYIPIAHRFVKGQLKVEIFHYKHLHFTLWDISRNINKLFGWTFVTIFMYYFLYAIYYVYAVFVRIQMPYSSALLRKSIDVHGRVSF